MRRGMRRSTQGERIEAEKEERNKLVGCPNDKPFPASAGGKEASKEPKAHLLKLHHFSGADRVRARGEQAQKKFIWQTPFL